jgi:DNA invertase Pin-like site-specific DNA recombinase
VEKMGSLRERGVNFVSPTGSTETTTVQGWLTFHIFSAPAEFERELSRERTMAGLKAARSGTGSAGGTRHWMRTTSHRSSR